MEKLKQLLAISKLSQKDSKWIHRDIFRILNKTDIWIAAYEKLKNNKSALTSGSIPKTIDGMSLDKLKRLKHLVYIEKYKFKPVKLNNIPVVKGKRKSLSRPTINDKIVQEVIRMILEAIYEPIFSEFSFGFRSGFGCHDALDHVKRKFRWVDYVIKEDIEQAYPTIDHHTLVKILKKRIDDPRFIRLIWKLLGCNVLNEERIIWSKIGLTQGSIVSPILMNIYYHELDDFVQRLKKDWETSNSNKNNLKSPKYKSLEYKINQVHGKLKLFESYSSEYQKFAKELKVLRTEYMTLTVSKNKRTRIEYVRYADHWMIGTSGDRKLAFDIKEQVINFMKNNLVQKPHLIKTTNLRKGNAHFLGYEIFLPRNISISKFKGKGVITTQRGQPELRFDIPVAKIIKRYVKRGYFKQLKDRVRPISKSSYSVLEDHVIVRNYRSIWLGLLNYYSGCTNRRRLQYIHYLLHMSCAMTLGHRHRISCSKIFKKHGKTLTVKVKHTDKTISFPYKTNWKLSEKKWLCGKEVIIPTHLYPNLISGSFLDLPYAICDSD